MKIWIDLCNSPHVVFFAGLIRELEGAHHVLLTCRPLGNTIELLDQHGFSYHVVGKHYGRNRAKKALGFPIRVWQLFSFLRGKGIDVAISHSSFYSPVVASLLGVRCIYLNDNEHALGNRISFLFADEIMVPEHLSARAVHQQGGRETRVTRYPGVKEGVYLWKCTPPAGGARRFAGPNGRKVIFVRPEPWTAEYYRGRKNFMDQLLIDLKDAATVVLLPRGKSQEEYYRQSVFRGVTIPAEPVRLADLARSCDLFIGAGGTMTREAAVLGVPTISIYQDNLLGVDRYLIRLGLMVHQKHLTSDFVLKCLGTVRKKPAHEGLLSKGRAAYGLIRDTLVRNGAGRREGGHA